jgi:hypothetical protein
MSCHPRVTEWTTIIHDHLPHLSRSQATVLALWSLGMVLARSCPKLCSRFHHNPLIPRSRGWFSPLVCRHVDFILP